MKENLSDLIIFELANNHQGSVAHGTAIIEELGKIVRKHNLRAAVKLQYRNLDTFIHPDYKGREDVKHISRFLQTRLRADEFYELVKAIKENGMLTMCTPFDEDSVDLCMDQGIEILKVASCSAVDWPLLEKIASVRRPVIVSVGGKTISDMDNVFNFFTHRAISFAMMHCVGLYPVSDAAAQLNCIDWMRARYHDIPIGYSGHEHPSDYFITQMAIAKGAKILERHIGMATDSIQLNAYSTDVRNVEDWIAAILRARAICGDERKKTVSQQELTSMNELARGCFAAASIKKGERVSRDKVFFAMPCQAGQTTSGQFSEEMIATRDYASNDALFEKRPIDLTRDMRSLIHDIKGMIYEAHIAVGNEFNLELSHHYGMEHFRHYGSSMISIVNREYCKKLIIMLPGQENPTHYHKIKEETFQVLYGTLRLIVENVEQVLTPGQIATVKRGARHSFSSDEGAIFEEISTTHVRNDSFYEDPRISGLDPMQRKTILTNW